MMSETKLTAILLAAGREQIKAAVAI